MLHGLDGVLASVSYRQGVDPDGGGPAGNYTDTVDTYVDWNNSGTSFGGSDDLTVYRDERHALVRFDNLFVSQGGLIPDNAIINSATLTLDVSGTENSANISIHRMLMDWDESSTWNDFGGASGIQINDSEAVSAPDDTVDGGDGTAVFDVTDSLNNWSLWGATNYGWVLDSDTYNDWKGTSSEKATTGDRPLLTVDYTEVDLFVTNTLDNINGDVTDIASLKASDGGDGISLREAITAANAPGSPGLDVIGFQIGSGYQQIALSSVLPVIDDPIILDARTQPGFSGTPLIELNGNALGNGDGLEISAGGSTVRGLMINQFNDAAIYIHTGDGNLIVGNWLGVDATGLAAPAANGTTADGISIESDNNIIGGDTAEERNLISGNVRDGVVINLGATGNQVIGNYIGLGADGDTAVGNGGDGVVIEGGASGNFIGGPNPGEGNVISANGDEGIVIRDAGTDGNLVRGNTIGLNAAGDAGLWQRRQRDPDQRRRQRQHHRRQRQRRPQRDLRQYRQRDHHRGCRYQRQHRARQLHRHRRRWSGFRRQRQRRQGRPGDVRRHQQYHRRYRR